jgi:hypothetical protein
MRELLAGKLIVHGVDAEALAGAVMNRSLKRMNAQLRPHHEEPLHATSATRPSSSDERQGFP